MRVSRIACTDEAGSRHVLIELQEEVEVPATMRSPATTIPGLRELRHEEWGPVNLIDEDTFKIVRTGQILRRAAA